MVCSTPGQDACLVSLETNAKRAKHVQATRIFDLTYRLFILKTPHTSQPGTIFVTELNSENCKTKFVGSVDLSSPPPLDNNIGFKQRTYLDKKYWRQKHSSPSKCWFDFFY
jgi:hypothetical protein